MKQNEYKDIQTEHHAQNDREKVISEWTEESRKSPELLYLYQEKI